MRILKISALMLACAAGALALSPARAEMDEHGGPQAAIEKMCSDTGMSEKIVEEQAVMAARIGVRLQLTDAQKAAFKDLQDTRAKAHADAKAELCASKPDFSSFEKRLAFRGAMLQRRLDTFKTVEPKLLAFYNSLDDKQKKEFAEMRQHMMHRAMEHGWRHHGGGEGWSHHEHEDNSDDE
ncbi:Spy/CpxP family protein refolding chaperone [Rhodoblastus sp.]|uniref:Spy/CpxP family protein refolding chaperone n=1 Tax=Rhodoblastus sp. TaxID=1962975 RepID=UPI003F9BCA15